MFLPLLGTSFWTSLQSPDPYNVDYHPKSVWRVICAVVYIQEGLPDNSLPYYVKKGPQKVVMVSDICILYAWPFPILPHLCYLGICILLTVLYVHSKWWTLKLLGIAHCFLVHPSLAFHQLPWQPWTESRFVTDSSVFFLSSQRQAHIYIVHAQLGHSHGVLGNHVYFWK